MNLFDKFLQVIDALENEGVDYVLIGGFAVIMYGLPRLTQDVDLFIRNDFENIQRLTNALYTVFKDPGVYDIKCEELNQYPVIRYVSPDGFCIDLLTKIRSLFTYEDLSYNVLKLEEHRIKIATPETLCRLKDGSLRPIDQHDSQFLRELIKKKETK